MPGLPADWLARSWSSRIHTGEARALSHGGTGKSRLAATTATVPPAWLWRLAVGIRTKGATGTATLRVTNNGRGRPRGVRIGPRGGRAYGVLSGSGGIGHVVGPAHTHLLLWWPDRPGRSTPHDPTSRGTRRRWRGPTAGSEDPRRGPRAPPGKCHRFGAHFLPTPVHGCIIRPRWAIENA
jgi:hypothetical protein